MLEKGVHLPTRTSGRQHPIDPDYSGKSAIQIARVCFHEEILFLVESARTPASEQDTAGTDGKHGTTV